MALTFVVQHTVTFDTNEGSDITWEIDILRSYEEGTTPDWFVSDGQGGMQAPDVTNLIGTGDPINIEWHKDDDIYKPLKGSTASLNLVVEQDGQYPNFSSAGQYEYQLRVRFQEATVNESSDAFLARINANGGAELGLSLVTTSFVDEGQILYRQGNTALSAGASWSDVSFFETQTTGSDDILDGVADGAPILVYGDDSNYAIYTVNTSTISNDDRATVVSLVTGVGTIPSTASLYLTTGSDNVSDFAPTDETVTFSFNDYWCGFITAIDGQESVTTVPFDVSFTAQDGLANLGNTTVPAPTTMDNINIFSEVLDAIYETGLNLPVYVNSGILHDFNTTPTDALTSFNAPASSLYSNEEATELISRKELVEGVLSAFNCTIYQSYGRWYIHNLSTHADDVTWDTYTISTGATQYSAAGSVAESLLYTIDGSSTQDLVPANEDLVLTRRRPYGSVECRPSSLIPINYTPNGDFSIGNVGFTSGITSTAVGSSSIVDSPLPEEAPKPSSINTNINRRDLGTTSDVWFQSDLAAVDPYSPTEISFAYLLDILATTGSNGVNNARLNWSILATTTGNVAQPNPNTFANSVYSSGLYFENIQTRDWYWNFERGEWVVGTVLDDGRKAATHPGISVSETTEETWMTASETVSSLFTYNEATGGIIDLPDASIRIRFWYATGESSAFASKKNRDDGTASIITYVTDIQMSNMFENDITCPVFERVQEDYTTTLAYEPRFVDGTSPAVYQRIIEEGFYRSGNVVEAALPETLERIVTQQKLNDFRSEFRYFEGTLINLSQTPLSMHHKIALNWSNFNEPRSLIMNGGNFSLKWNEFDVAMYLPDQTTDVAGGDGALTADGNTIETYGFFPHNVNLQPAPFPGRSNQVTYWVALVVDGLNDSGAALDTSDDNSGVFDSLEPEVPVIRVQGVPGQVIEGNTLLVARGGFEASASNMRWFGDGGNSLSFFSGLADDDNADDTPTNLNNISFTDVGPNIQLSYTITIPAKPEFEQLHIAGEVDIEIADNRDFDITFALASSVGNAVLTSTMRGLRGIPLTVSFANVIIAPSAGNELDATSFSVSGDLPTGVSLIGFSQLGTSVIGEFAVTFQSTGQDVTITLTGDSGTALPTGVDTSVVDFTIVEDTTNADGGVAGINNASTIDGFSITGVRGSTAEFNIPIYAADNYELSSNNFSAVLSGTTTGITMYDAVGGGESVQIPLRISFPVVDTQNTTIEIRGSAQEIGAETVNVEVTFTNTNTDVVLTELTETFTGAPRTVLPYSNDVIATSGNNLTALSLGTLTGDTGGVTLTTNLPSGSDRGTIVGTINFGDANRAVTVPINTTTTAEPNTLFVNIANNIVGAAISRSQLQIGFGNDEIGDGIATIATDAERTFTIEATDAGGAFTAATNVTATGDLTINTGSIDSGVITKMVTGVVPMPDAAGNAYANITLEGTLGDFFVDGLNQASVPVYRRFTTLQETAPTPSNTGTHSYTFSTSTLSSAPADWSITIPATGGDFLYVSFGAAASRTNTDDDIVFAQSALLVQNGADGERGPAGGAGVQGAAGDTITIFYSTAASGGTVSTTDSGQAFWRVVEHAVGVTPTTPTTGFVMRIGEDGEDGNGIWAIYAEDADGTDANESSVNREWVTFFESEVTPFNANGSVNTSIVTVGDETFVPYVGQRTELLVIYSRTTGDAPTPANTVVTFTVGADATWTAPTGWSKTQSTAPGTGTLYQATETASVITSGTDTVTWDEGISIVDEAAVETIADASAAAAVGELNVPEPVQTFPVRFSTGTSLQPYVYQYLDGNNMTRAATIFAPDSVTICVAGANQDGALANSSFTSNPNNDGTITTGGGVSCEIGSTDSATVSGHSIIVNIGGTAGTAPDTIYIT